MSPESTTQSTKICPTCGTRISESATRCLVCGRTFNLSAPNPTTTAKSSVRAPRMPELTLSLPLVLGLIFLVLAIGAGGMFLLTRQAPAATVEGGNTVTPSPTLTPTSTITQTPTITLTPTIAPTFTPLPPIEYTVKSLDTCEVIAQTFGIQVGSLLAANPSLSASGCGNLIIGQKLLIPQPTPTTSPMPSQTLSAAEATEQACEKYPYIVKENDTLSTIAANYNVSAEVIKEYNGLTTDIVFVGQLMDIPLCRRNPTPGPTPTPTLPPPYSAPNLLQPKHGQVFLGDISIVLTWASSSTLRSNEAYAITVKDITASGAPITEYVTDNKLILPESARPTDNAPHVFSWRVTIVRQNGTDSSGEPIYTSAGETSEEWIFVWMIGNDNNTP